MVGFLRRLPLHRLAQAIFILNAGIWIFLAIGTVLSGITKNADRLVMAAVLAVFMVGNAAGMALFAVFIGKRNRWLYFSAVAFLLLNIILTVTDQVGIWDWVTLVIDILLFGILIVIRGRYRQRLDPKVEEAS